MMAALDSSLRPTGEFAAAAEPLEEGENLKVGIIFVGSQRDLGWNQAASCRRGLRGADAAQRRGDPRREHPGDRRRSRRLPSR